MSETTADGNDVDSSGATAAIGHRTRAIPANIFDSPVLPELS